MTRFRALIRYDGTAYYGWQVQKRHITTVQSTLQSAFATIAGKPVAVTGAGRTDSGVHALGQIAHLDWESDLAPDKLLYGVNSILPDDIRVKTLEEASPDFHARFDAHSKIYLYQIYRSRVTDPFLFRYSYQYWSPLQMDLLEKCCRTVEGEHDFIAFQGSRTDVVSTVRTIFAVTTNMLDERGDPVVQIRFHAPGFLRKMVRFLVGTFIEIASGKKPFDDLIQALDGKDKSVVGIPAPACGLFLEQVIY